MATKLLFEDNEKVPISMLLKKSYNGNNIFFSGGCDKLLRKAIAIQNPGDFIVIYYDVAPNNVRTTSGYRQLQLQIKILGIKNMIVVPIICIEYVVVNYLYKNNQLIIPNGYKEMEEHMLKNLDWRSYISKCNPNNYIAESIEHFYKYIITQVQPQLCKRNTHKYINGGTQIDYNSGCGKYFYMDCPCGRFCKLNCNDCLAFKAERIYMELPIATITDDQHREYIEKQGIKIVRTQVSNVENERQEFYNSLCENMGINKFKVKIGL